MHIAQGKPRARRAGGASAACNGHRGRAGGVSGQRRRVARSWRPKARRVSWRRASWRGQRSWRPRRESWRGQCSMQWTQRTSWRVQQRSQRLARLRKWRLRVRESGLQLCCPANLPSSANSPSSSSPSSASASSSVLPSSAGPTNSPSSSSVSPSSSSMSSHMHRTGPSSSPSSASASSSVPPSSMTVDVAQSHRPASSYSSAPRAICDPVGRVTVARALTLTGNCMPERD